MSYISTVMLWSRGQRPKFWPRTRPSPRQVGLDLELEHLALAWPRSCKLGLEKCVILTATQCRILYFVVRLCSVKCELEPFMQSNCGITKTWSGTLIWEFKNSITCVLLALLPYSEISTCGLGLMVLASTSASEFWPRSWHFGLV